MNKMFRLLVISACIALALGLPQPRGIPRLDGRIVGGEDTTIEEYPYQISLQVYSRHICGGSIIGRRHILTAAHCTDGRTAGDFSVRVGSTIKGSGGQVYNVNRLDQNPLFSFAGFDSDVSILTLSSDIQFGSGVQPIGLASTEPADNSEAIVTGWGALYSNGPSPSILQKVTVNMMSRTLCKLRYGDSKINQNMICAAAPGKDACQGDSGGPIVSNGEQVGIVSWGYGCADATYPGVYSNIASLRYFIDAYSQE